MFNRLQFLPHTVQRRLGGVGSLLVVWLLAGFAAGCDSAPEPPPDPVFEARRVGADGTDAFEGTSGYLSAAETQAQIAPILVLLPTLTDQLPPEVAAALPEDPPPGTAVVMGEDLQSGQGKGITLYFRGAERPEPGTYSVGALDPDTGMPADAVAFYTRYTDTELEGVPGIQGTVTIEASSTLFIRGSFRFETTAGVQVPVPVPTDGSGARVTSAAATVSGTFTATPGGLSRPPLPGLPLP